MNKYEKLADLRHIVDCSRSFPERSALALGVAGADDALGGGLMPGTLHEVYAGDWSAGGFAACLAIRAAGRKPLFWVRPDYEALEYGALHAGGLLELGGDPANLILLRAANPLDALAASADILACPDVGALVLEISGNPKCLDLVASRRLAFAAAESGVTLVLLREGAMQMASAALSRWHVAAAPSSNTNGAANSAEDVRGDDWGRPAFAANLVRNRIGPTGFWTLQWDPEDGLFRETPHTQYTAHPGALAAAPADRPDYPRSRQRRA